MGSPLPGREKTGGQVEAVVRSVGACEFEMSTGRSAGELEGPMQVQEGERKHR